MTLRSVVVCVVSLATCACTGFGPVDVPSIAGRYELVAVDGGALPCCGEADSTGARTTIVGGSLTLGRAAPEKNYVETPGGSRPGSCVHEVPNGAHVDINGVVTLPDGSTYQLPECGDGSYTMVITRRIDEADGTSRTVSDTSAGRYAWSDGESAVVSLLSEGLVGPVARSDDGVDLKVQPQNLGRGPEPGDRQYEFFRGR